MIISFEVFFNFIKSLEFLFLVEALASCVKVYFLFFLISKAIKSQNITKPLLYLLGVLFGGLVGDIAWLVKIIYELWYPSLDYRFVLFFVRIAWACTAIQFQALSLFAESLYERNYKVSIRQKILLLCTSFFIIYFLYLAFVQFNLHQNRPTPEKIMMRLSVIYELFFLMILSLLLTVKKLRTVHVPKILKKQLSTLIIYLLAPYVFTELMQAVIMFRAMIVTKEVIISTLMSALVSIPNLLLTFAIYHAMRKIMGLRFLNFQNHVQGTRKFNFIDDFKNVLEKFSHVNSLTELNILVQLFFKDAFKVAPDTAHLYLRKLSNGHANPIQEHKKDLSERELIIERYINNNDLAGINLAHVIKEHKILIYDEIVFNSFYQEDKSNHALVQFLERINAAVFLPIYEHTTLIAYIIIERNARMHEFFNDIERDEMLVFASYLGNVIHLLQNRNLTLLIAQKKELREELFHKHQEVNQYKESVRSFLRSSQQRKIGILFYKNKRFMFGNQAAKELIDVDLNTHVGHPLAQACKKIAQQVENYKSSQSCFVLDAQGNKLVLSGIPSLEHNTVIITVCYPEIADIIKHQIDVLKNPTDWDYLLYLETTKSGQLISQLIPSSGPQLLHFKIELLKIALSKKAILLQMPEADLVPTVEIIHHISLRETLQVMTLSSNKTIDSAIQLFGINPLLGVQEKQPSLLEQLNNIGTLFIQNIHLLDIAIQEKLAEFIKYGYYTVYKGDQRVISDVRIIVSTHQALESLVHEGKFSQCLFNELQKAALSMPLLSSLAADEVQDLADGFTQQALRTPMFKNLLELTPKEKHALVYDRPMSLVQFKMKIQQLLQQKSKKNSLESSMEFEQSFPTTDPVLVHAARLGKKALKDPQLMNMLWHKFKNQNKIAAFLGVNRSSVNRRCKEYNLI